MNNQLSNISTQYRKFSKGQYIEHTQFNEFLDFFEDQDRLSRVMLQGVGIVCGLQAKPVYKDRLLKAVRLSQGIAVTTDGDLLTLQNTSKVSEELYVSDLKTTGIENKEYTHFRAYDNFKIKYPAFYDGEKQIELWELATDLEKSADFLTVDHLSNVEDIYLLLYLESYEKEVKPCRGVDCDNHGIQQIRNLKILATNADGILHILKKDGIQPHPLFLKDILKDEKLERVIVDRLISERGPDASFSSEDLKKMYASVLEKYGYGESVFAKVNAIAQMIGIPTVDHQIFKTKLKECLVQLLGFQYAYDIVKDLTSTYSEITALLPKAFTKCFPDLVSFPKHIMLGKLTSDTALDPYRHQLYNAPVLDDEKAGQRIKLLISRFAQQAKKFRYSADFEGKAEIKVTPSQKLNTLSNKAVPFYYEISEEFLKTWNFDKTGNRSYRENLGYDTELLLPDAHIQNPVPFNIDRNSFYNIEGHHGVNYQEAFQQIKKIRDEQQLGFDIMVLSFEELVRNKDLSKAYFNDYIQNHPGLEHLHGVEKGGTFVMVYEINGRATPVIADFALPYICCTPKVKINLSLPGSTICEKADPIPFTVLPFNGVVTADVDSTLNSGVESRNGLYFFNPQTVSKELHGKEITFSVNGSPADCSIKVISQPEVKIETTSIIHPEGTSVETAVSFHISGGNVADYQYSWDFLGNGSFILMNPDENGNIKYTFYRLDPKRIPAIRVIISGNGCTQTVTVSNWYKEIPVVINRISFPEGGDCCEGSQK